MGNLYEVCRELNVAISLELKKTIKRGREGEGLPILWLYETHTLLNYYWSFKNETDIATLSCNPKECVMYTEPYKKQTESAYEQNVLLRK